MRGRPDVLEAPWLAEASSGFEGAHGGFRVQIWATIETSAKKDKIEPKKLTDSWIEEDKRKNRRVNKSLEASSLVN